MGAFLYKALMNGVSHMIPFVVAGGLLIAVSLAVGGTPTAEGLQIEPGTFWDKVNQIGVVAFGLMIPVLSGFIASAIADRPGLAPGMITGLIANTGALYGANGGAGFIGAIITGFLSGFIALGLKKIPVHKYVAPIMPIIVIPVVTTLAVGLLFIYVAGAPIAAAFAALSSFLMSLQGGSVLILGAIIGAMIAFDLGGPVNKTAFLFGGGLIAAGNAGPMGMAAAAIAVPPLAMGTLTLVRRKMFNAQERESGIAALFMGFFGITEGAIPFAASRPLQVIPANVLGGAVAGALAAGLAVKDNVMHGGPIVAVLGAVENVAGFSAALLAGVVVTVVVAMLLIRWGTREENLAPAAHADTGKEPVLAGATAAAPSLAGTSTTAHAAASPEAPAATAQGSLSAAEAPRTTGATPAQADDRAASGATGAGEQRGVMDYISPETVLLDVEGAREDVIRRLVDLGVGTGQISDPEDTAAAALAREAQGTTAVGNGIAIPHAKTAGVHRPMIAFARSTQGIDWGASDGEPATIVFLIAVPAEQAGSEHLKILATLARALMRAPFKEALTTATTRHEATRVIQEAIGQ